MLGCTCWLVLVVPPLLLAQQQEQEAVEAAIKQLASSDFKERQKATQWLLERPSAAPLLRKALPKANAEAARRIALLLDDFEARPLRALQACVKEGDLKRATELIASWPEGKDEAGVWAAALQLIERLYGEYARQGWKVRDLAGATIPPPLVISGKEVTSFKEGREEFGRFQFIRAQEVNITKRPVLFLTGGKIVFSSGPVRIDCELSFSSTVFGKSDVRLAEAEGVIIVSGGDVVVDRLLHGSLIVARGSVTFKSQAENAWVISGQKVIGNRKRVTNCKFFEDVEDPLDFLRRPFPTEVKKVGPRP